eukprot:6647031-Pyramimonas_sp.AAC.1
MGPTELRRRRAAPKLRESRGGERGPHENHALGPLLRWCSADEEGQLLLLLYEQWPLQEEAPHMRDSEAGRLQMR